MSSTAPTEAMHQKGATTNDRSNAGSILARQRAEMILTSAAIVLNSP
jgi:hypothetical protein